MQYLILLMSFLTIYHINFFLIKDIFSYYYKNNIRIDKKLYIDLILICTLPIIIPFLITCYSNAFAANLVIESIFCILLGIYLTKGFWTSFLNRMKRYKDTYFFHFSKKDFYTITKNLSSASINKKESYKTQQILSFMKSYPYKLYLNSSKEINACSILNENKIIITKGILKLPIEEIKAALAHEIIHFKINEKNSDKVYKIKFFIRLYLIYFFLLIIVGITKKIFPVISILCLSIFFIFNFLFIFYHLLIPERYLYHLQELKCDRLACKLPGVTTGGMISLLSRLQKLQKPKKYIWYQEIIYRYFLFEAHPNIEFRIKSIKKYHNWSILEFIKYPNYMLIRIISGKGWN